MDRGKKIMWISVVDEPVPTYGMDGKTFLLNLCYQKYYGHDTLKDNEVVTAVWDSVNECFYESKTKQEVDSRDIAEWWKDI